MKKIKVKGPTQRLIDPADFAKAMGAEETNKKINTKQDPMSLFILRQGLMNNESAQLAVDITERLFSEAPLHLKRPQAVELSKLTLEQLQVIARIKRFPIPKRTRDRIVSELESEELVKRMEKRWRLAKSVLNAEKKGLYEAAEHATGMLDLGDKVKIKYVKCQKCGWIHFIETSVDAPWKCFNCGNDERKTFVKALKKEVPLGSTIQPINRLKTSR